MLKMHSYTYVLNNPLKYTDPSGYTYYNKRIQWEENYHEDNASYSSMMGIINDAMNNTPGGGGGYDLGPSASSDNSNLVYLEGPEGGVWAEYGVDFITISSDDAGFLDFFNNLDDLISGDDFSLSVEYLYGKLWIVGTNVSTGDKSSFAGTNNSNYYTYNEASISFEQQVIGKLDVKINIRFWRDFDRAAGAFAANYAQMRTANTIGADKYFHCKANFAAASYGPGGLFFAEHFSNFREIWDQNVKHYPRLDSELDQEANFWGREQVGVTDDPCEACAKYRPEGLPDKY